jgi:hypothetical protein
MLTGTGFDTTAENNVITIGDISCTPYNVSADGTTITINKVQIVKKIGSRNQLNWF